MTKRGAARCALPRAARTTTTRPRTRRGCASSPAARATAWRRAASAAEDVGDEGCRGQGHEVDAAGDADDEARRGEVRAPQGRAYDDDAAVDEEGLRFLPGRALGEEVRGVLLLRDRALRLRRDRMGYDDEGDVLRLQARGDAEDDEGLLRRRAHGEGLPLPAFGVSGERRPLGGRARLYYDANDDYQGLRGRARYGVETRGFCAEDVGDEGRRGRAHDDGHERHRGRGRVGGERQSSCANDDDQGLRGGAHDDPDEPRRGRVLLTLRARLKDDDDEELMRDQEGALGDEVHRGANGYREGHRSAHDDGEGPPFAALDDGEERPLGGLVEELFVCRLGDDDEVRVGANHNGEGRRLRGPRPDGEEARVRCGRAYQLAPRAHAQEEPRVRRDRAQEDEEEPPVRRGRARSPLRLQARGDAEDGEGLPFRLRAHGEGLPLPGLGVGGRARLYGEGLGREDDAERLEVAVDDAEGVGGLEAGADLPEDGHRLLGRHEPLAPEPLEEALAGEELHHEEQVPLGRAAEVGDPDDVVVLERARDLRLAPEALHDVGGGGEVRAQHLHRDVLAQVDVARLEHGAHPTRREVRDELVAPVQRRADERERLERRQGLCRSGRHRRRF